MVSADKLTILLADEDALRRDGLAAVLQGNPRFEVVAQCQDGEAAIQGIRQWRPDVAVVDLNLPKLHGIELVRCVRAEALGTKIVVLSGTADDDIIREVVRAGGDAYLLKNGPARHLIDAISYVRDGGQYFSPQLRRDGLDRHLLEEAPRPVAEPAEHAPERARGERVVEPDETSGDAPSGPRTVRDSRYGRTRRSGGRPAGRTSDPQRLRERLREESGGESLADRDYEILGMMADGIKPILDRLDEIEGRVGEMESGDAPVPGNVGGWLNTQIVDTFQDPRASGRDVAPGRTLSELEARLPQLIEEAVTNRFHNMATKLHQEIEETHVRTLETFVKNIQVKLVRRVSALETDMSEQAEAMHQLREYSQRTEDNLSRLITGVDKLAQELPKLLAAPGLETTMATASMPGSKVESGARAEMKKGRRRSSRSFSPKLFWMATAAIAIFAVAAFQVPKWLGSRKAMASVYAPNAATAGNAGQGSLLPPVASADIKTKLAAADAYTERKDYAMAEDIYRQVIKAEPRNADAIKALASVLYREDKIEESAAILDKLPGK